MRGFLRWGLCDNDNVKKCPKQLLFATKCRIAAEKFPHYFWFSAVRNPFDRAFSLYSHSLLSGKLPHDQNNDAGRFPRETFDHCASVASQWGKKERNKIFNPLWSKNDLVPKDFNPPNDKPLPQELLEITYNSTYTASTNINSQRNRNRKFIYDSLDVNYTS